MIFFRIIQHLLPDGAAWRTLTQKPLRKFFEGIAAGVPTDAKAYVDGVYDDLRPDTTNALDEWERQFALPTSTNTATRRLQLTAAWQAQGGQSPRYLQDTLQSAGFDVYVHEWPVPATSPRVARDPRSYTSLPLIGTVQCGEDVAQCGEFDAQCDAFLVNDPGYLVNENLLPIAPPPIPDDPASWRNFVYIGGAVFGDSAFVDGARRAELERLVLKLRPSQDWIVLLVVYLLPLEDIDGALIADDDNASLLA